MKINGKPLVPLPTCNYHHVSIDFASEEDRNIYNAAEKAGKEHMKELLRKNLVLQNYAHVLVILLRLRQLCNHSELCPPDFINVLRASLDDNTVNVFDSLSEESIEKLNDALKDAIENSEDCCICLSNLENGRITPCGHFFCLECIQQVLHVRTLFKPH